MRMRERKMNCRGYVDLGCYFMSVVHAVQWEVEKWGGVPPDVTRVVKALREGVKAVEAGGGEKELKGLVGRYETAYGLTDPVEIMKGLGQGDLASPERSKLLLSVIATAVNKTCEGAKVAGTDERVSTLFFADDGMILADDVQTLGRAFETIWMVTQIAGLSMQIKNKKKSAWSATYWESDGTEKDVEGWEIRMPDGTLIPQGRAAIITWEDAVKIEEARVEVLRSKGIANGKPRAAIYGDRQSGLQHEHAYANATAALYDGGEVEALAESGNG